jgi:hypothetical protein
VALDRRDQLGVGHVEGVDVIMTYQYHDEWSLEAQTVGRCCIAVVTFARVANGE